MRIGLASDHGGYKLKKELIFSLKKEGFEVADYGAYDEERSDFPVYAFKLCEGVKKKDVDFGITICKTGIGMSIACNKVEGIMCAKVDNYTDARYAKEHNDANVISFAAYKSHGEVLNLINEYINSKIDIDERYNLRRKMIRDYENEH